MNRSDCTAENRTGSIHLNLETLSGNITKSITNTEAQFLKLGESLQHIYSQSGNLIKGMTGAAESISKLACDPELKLILQDKGSHFCRSGLNIWSGMFGPWMALCLSSTRLWMRKPMKKNSMIILNCFRPFKRRKK